MSATPCNEYVTQYKLTTLQIWTLLSKLECGFDDILHTDVEWMLQRTVVLMLMLLIPGTKTYSHAKQHTLLFTEPVDQSRQAQSVHRKQQTAHVTGKHFALVNCQKYAFRPALFADETLSPQLRGVIDK